MDRNTKQNILERSFEKRIKLDFLENENYFMYDVRNISSDIYIFNKHSQEINANRKKYAFG